MTIETFPMDRNHQAARVKERMDADVGAAVITAAIAVVDVHLAGSPSDEQVHSLRSELEEFRAYLRFAAVYSASDNPCRVCGQPAGPHVHLACEHLAAQVSGLDRAETRAKQAG